MRELWSLRSGCGSAPSCRGRSIPHVEALGGAGRPVFDRLAPAGLKTFHSAATRAALRRGPFSRQVMRQPSGILPRTSNDGFCQRCCHMARTLVVLVLIAAQRSSPRTAQPDIQGDVRRDSGGAASHWSIPEPHGPAEARRDHQSSCGGAAERRQDIVQSQRKQGKRVCVPRLAHKMPDFDAS